MESKFGRHVVAAFVSHPTGIVVLGLALAGVVAPGAAGIARAQMGPASVVVSRVVEREVTAGQTFIGTVQPARNSVVGSAVEGRVIEFAVKRGDWVTQGQTLAQILTETLEIEIAAARAELKLRQHELEELENGSLPEEIAQAKAKMAGAEATMRFAQAKFKRTDKLYQQQRSVSEEELDEARSAATAAAQNYVSAQASYDLAMKGPRKEKIDQARARMLVQQEQVHLLEDRLKKYTIHAPFDGYVTAEHTEVGQWISKADPIAEVVELDPVETEVHVPERYIAHTREKMSVQVHVSALPNHVFQGVVAHIVPQADVRSRTFPVTVRLANPQRGSQRLLKAGMLARVMLPVGGTEKTTMVPKDALVLGGPTPSVYVVRTDAKKQLVAQPVSVQTGVADGSLIQVTGALKPGERVVVRGNERLRPGQTVVVASELAARQN